MPAMNDREVASEMSKMVSFIKQEALEKAREIKTKADEEFAIEKGKIVRQESLNIDAQFDKKRKQAEISKKIAQSNMKNKSRLELLQTREQLLDEVFEAASGKITAIQKGKGKYKDLLKNLVLQALYTLMEPEVTLVCRKADEKAIKDMKDEVVKTFNEKVKFDLTLEVITELSDNSAGGVTLVGYNSRIVVDNTLDERLRLLQSNMLPEIRMSLFGKNPNRAFYT